MPDETAAAPIERPHHEGLEARIADAITPTLEHMGYELVRVQVQGKERPTVQIMADRVDGTQFTVSDCENISHAAGAVLDVDDPIKGEWMLEVSSPGIDRPLTRLQDFAGFEGFEVKIELARMQEGRRRFRGLLAGVFGDTIKLKLDDGEIVSWRFHHIADARLVLTDALIAEDLRRAKERGDDQSEFSEDDADTLGAEDQE